MIRVWEGCGVTERIEAVQRMQDYIDAHLAESITPGDLARAAWFSPWHAARMFREETGMSPAAYIRRLRLSRSAMRLRDSDARVLDIALELGCGSVDGYQRAFRRVFGVNPSDWARRRVPIPLFTPYGVLSRRSKEESSMKETETVFVQVIDKPARKLALRRGVKAADYYAYCAEVGCDVWGLLCSMIDPEEEPLSLWLPERYIRPGTSVYAQGVELPLSWAGVLPEGFEVIELPAAKYLRFQGEPYPEDERDPAISRVRAAMKRYDPARFGLQWDDDSPRYQLAPIAARGYVEYRAVKEI